MLQQLPYRAKSAYAHAARSVGKVLVATHLMSTTVPPRTHRWRHWAHSLVVVHDSAALSALDVPWWTYDATDVVDGWLSARTGRLGRPLRVFEYGSGASTLWLSRRVGTVYSVEHHEGFAEHMRPLFAQAGNIEFLLRPPVPTKTPAVPSRKPGNRDLDFARYVESIDRVGGEFDLVVIDGRAREACLTAAIPHLADDGLIVFDNSHRRRYQEAIAASRLLETACSGLTPTLPYPDRTSLLRKTGTPESGAA